MNLSLLERSKYFLTNADFKAEDIVELQNIIREHNALYYNEESPVISDMEYDELFKLLKNLEEKFNIFDKDSPTKRIDVLAGNQFKKGLHKYPMISLDNTYDAQDLRDFEKRIFNIIKKDITIKYLIELKFD
jgi:DNA ligase (NAD+)